MFVLNTGEFNILAAGILVIILVIQRSLAVIITEKKHIADDN